MGSGNVPKSKPEFSITIPSYTGAATIDATFDALIAQAEHLQDAEVVVLLDGPNKDLEQVVEAAKERFSDAGISYRHKALAENRGRFVARQEAANEAKADRLLFMDDRIQVGEGFFEQLFKRDDNVIIPNVLETSQPNAISRLNYLIRLRVYGKKKWGEDFESFDITAENFESSAKGTGCLWVPKKLFLDICKEMGKGLSREELKRVSDDTRLLRMIVDSGESIRRESAMKVYYSPRSEYGAELHHLYKRGIFFVDHYIKPGTRFFPFLMAMPIVLLVALAVVVVAGMSILAWIGLGILGLLALLTLFLARRVSDVIVVIVHLPITLSVFCAGVVRGFYHKFLKRQ